ncbi:MAG: hypothetical protein AAGI88_24595 [Pseudomonadota bacterium]
MQAGFGLEPLSGEAEGNGGAGCGFDIAEGGVARLPDFCAGAVGGEDRSADMVGVDEVDLAALDHGDGRALQPDIFAQERGGAVKSVDLVFGNAVAIEIVYRMDGIGVLCQAPHDLLAEGVVEVFGLDHPTALKCARFVVCKTFD